MEKGLDDGNRLVTIEGRGNERISVSKEKNTKDVEFIINILAYN